MTNQEWTNPQTSDAWSWFTDEKNARRLAQTREFVENALGLALGKKIRLVQRQELKFGPEGTEYVGDQTDEQLTVSDKACSILAMQLERSFGADCPVTVSDKACSILAMQLERSFGADCPDGVYNLDTWAGSMAFGAALLVDWRQLAVRLLCKFTLEYVPGEAGA